MRFEDKLIENLIFGRSRLNSRVFEKLFISYSCILFIKHCALRSFCIKMLCFSKNWFFQIFDQSNLLLDWLKLRLKTWFESAWLDRCSIDARSIECDFQLIESNFRPIKNRSKSFFTKTNFSCVLHYFKLFKKNFSLSLSSTDLDSTQFFVVFFQIFLKVFVF